MTQNAISVRHRA